MQQKNEKNTLFLTTDFTDYTDLLATKMQKREQKMTKKGLFWALTNTDFSPRTKADFLPHLAGGGR
jgi:hypothetical protein